MSTAFRRLDYVVFTLLFLLLIPVVSAQSTDNTIAVQPVPSTTGADSLENIQQVLTKCEKDLESIQVHAKQDCKYASVSQQACNQLDALATSARDAISMPVIELPPSAIAEKKKQCQRSSDNLFGCMSVAHGKLEKEESREYQKRYCDPLKTQVGKCYRELNQLQGPGPYPSEYQDPELVERWKDDYEYYSDEHESCLAQLARHDECLGLMQQAVSVSEACQEIRESLLSARLERQQQPQEEPPQQQAQEEPQQQQPQEESPQQ